MSSLWAVVGREVLALAVCWTGEDPHLFPVIQQTYHFETGTVVVTPLHAETSTAQPIATSEPTFTQVIPASFTQNPAPPLPADDLPVPAELSPESIEGATAATPLIPPCPTEIPGLATLSPREISRRYQEIYSGIPFSRAEYDANPSYRHDTTVELLFGQVRPTVIHRSHTRVDVQLPPVAISPWAYNPYGMNSLYYPFYSHGVRVYRGR